MKYNKHIDQIIPYQRKKTPIAIDFEGFQMEKPRLHRPTGKFACVTFTVGKDVYLVTKPEMVHPSLDNIQDATWVIQNAAFDITQLRRWAKVPPRKQLWDTLLIERLLWAGYYERFALSDMVRRYYNVYLNKDVRDTFEKATALNEEQIYYACLDGIWTLKVRKAQKKQIKKGRGDVKNTYANSELPAMWAFQDFQGFRLNVEDWESLAHSAEEKEKALDSFGINPRSPQQVLKKLRSTGFSRLKNTQAGTLQQYLERYPDTEAAEFTRKLLEYRSYKKLASTYGMNFIDNYLEEENGYHVIHANYKTIGARTLRTSSGNPNLQNIPIRKAPEYRRPWIARPGNKLAVIDWQAQEAKIHAYETQDPVLLDIFEKELDVYTAAYNLMYDANITKDDPRRSDIGKPSFLGACYGQTPEGIAERYGMSLAAAEDMQARFWNVFQGSAVWCTEQRKKKNYTENAYGARIWLNAYSSQCERNALNDPHQSLAALMMKMSLGRLHQSWKPEWGPYGVVAQVHDEMILDCPEEVIEEVSQHASKIMVDVAEELTPGIKHKATPVVCDNWLEGK